MANNFTNEGYKKNTADEIRQNLTGYVLQKAPSFKQQSADIQNNLIDTAVPLILEIQNIFADFANSYAPGFQNRFMWEQLAQSTGLEYTDERKASVLLKFTGKEGDYIPKGTTVTGNFTTEEPLTIGTSGEAFITAYSDDDNAYQAKDTITEIKTSVPTGVTVTNPSDSNEKIEGKTDSELKLEAQRNLRNARVSNADYVIMLLLQTGKIKERLVSFRRLDGQIECIIGGGDVNEIANILLNGFINTSKFISMPSNNETERTVKTDVYFYNSKVPIVWTIPKNMKLDITLELTLYGTVVNTTQFQMDAMNALMEIINNIRVGTPLSKYVIEKPIYAILEGYGIESYQVSKINWEIKSGDAIIDFSSDNYLNGIDFDVYVTFGNFSSFIFTI